MLEICWVLMILFFSKHCVTGRYKFFNKTIQHLFRPAIGSLKYRICISHEPPKKCKKNLKFVGKKKRKAAKILLPGWHAMLWPLVVAAVFMLCTTTTTIAVCRPDRWFHVAPVQVIKRQTTSTKYHSGTPPPVHCKGKGNRKTTTWATDNHHISFISNFQRPETKRLSEPAHVFMKYYPEGGIISMHLQRPGCR